MSEQEYLNTLKSLYDSDRELADAFLAEYRKDSLADKGTLLTKAKASLGRYEGVQGLATAKNVFPLTTAFGKSDTEVASLLNTRSPSNWTRLPAGELKDAAIRGGYVKPLTKYATEKQKQEQRDNFGKFLGILAKESTDLERRNVVKDYERTQFLKEPVGWTRKLINDILFRTYSKRAKEQALLGEGASDRWGRDLDMGDVSTLGTDMLANAAYGAGAGGLSSYVARRGLMGPAAGLRTARNLFGSDVAAGVAGGTADVLNRAINTREGVMPYEFATEPAAGGIANALMAPGMLRSATSQALSFLRGGKTGGFSRRGAMQKTAEWVANRTGWDEAELARLFSELGASPDYATAPLSAETRKKIEKMREIWDDGLVESPGKTYSLFDELQLEYENHVTPAISGWNNKGEAVSTKEILPSTEEFVGSLDKRIAELKGEYANAAGREEAPALKRKIEYFENARDMFGSGLLHPDEVLYRGEPNKFVLENRPTFGAGSATPAELMDPHTPRDLNIMREFVMNANQGLPVNVIDHPMADELMRLSTKYPEFGRYMQNMETRKLKEEAPSMWTVSKDWIYGDRVKKGNSMSEAVLSGVAKPAVVVKSKNFFDRPDESLEAVQKQVEELKARKPEATDAALNWKFNPRLEQSQQLTAEERNLLNRYKALQLNEAMNGL